MNNKEYIPSIKSIRRLYTKYNRLIFKSLLPKSSDINFQIGNITIKTNYGDDVMETWAYTEVNGQEYRIKFLPKYKNIKLFITILVHEMVHVWENEIYKKMSHGPNFFSMKEVISKHDIELKRFYDDEDFM